MTKEKLVERLAKAMLAMDCQELADLYTREFGIEVIYIGDGFFEEVDID